MQQKHQHAHQHAHQHQHQHQHQRWLSLLAMFLPAFAESMGAASAADGRWEYSAEQFPSVWFGANESGPDAQHLAENDIDKYAAVYFGWQAGNGVTGCRHEELWLRNQTAAVKALKPSINTLAYIGNGASVLDFYDAQRAVTHNPAYSGFFLSKQRTNPGLDSIQSSADCPNSAQPGVQPTWDFRNASAVDYFVEHVVGQWAEDNVTDSVFIDEGDNVACYGHPDLPNLSEQFKWSNGSLDAYRRSAAMLNAKGKRLIVSLKNGFIGASPIAAKFKLCPVPLDDFVEAMQGEKFIRFHEYFGALQLKDKPGPSGINGKTMCNNLIRTAQREAATPNMAFSAHGGSYWLNYGYVEKTSLDLSFALFMLTRNATVGGEMDWFGWSTGQFWYTRNWNWSETAHLYTKRYGEAQGVATAQGDIWTRTYEHAKFSVDCSTFEATIQPS